MSSSLQSSSMPEEVYRYLVLSGSIPMDPRRPLVELTSAIAALSGERNNGPTSASPQPQPQPESEPASDAPKTENQDRETAPSEPQGITGPPSTTPDPSTLGGAGADDLLLISSSEEVCWPFTLPHILVCFFDNYFSTYPRPFLMPSLDDLLEWQLVKHRYDDLREMGYCHAASYLDAQSHRRPRIDSAMCSDSSTMAPDDQLRYRVARLTKQLYSLDIEASDITEQRLLEMQCLEGMRRAWRWLNMYEQAYSLFIQEARRG